MAEGAGHPVIVRAVHALAFMEAVGGIAISSQLSKHTLLTAAVDEHATHAKAGLTAPTRKAPQTP